MTLPRPSNNDHSVRRPMPSCPLRVPAVGSASIRRGAGPVGDQVETDAPVSSDDVACDGHIGWQTGASAKCESSTSSRRFSMTRT
jgi:hypothetical protein